MKMQKYQEPVLKNSFSGDKVGAYCDHCLHHLLAPTLGHPGKSLKLDQKYFTDNFLQLALISQPPGTQQSNTLVKNQSDQPWIFSTWQHSGVKKWFQDQKHLPLLLQLQLPLEFRIIRNNKSVIEFTFRWLSSCSPTASSTPTLPWTPSSTRFSQKTLKRVSERYSL